MSEPRRTSEDEAASDAAVRLRTASTADWPLIRRWLGEPGIVRWWGPKATSEAVVLLALGSEHAICRMIEADGADVGYAQALDIASSGEALPAGIEPGTWDIDLFIASPAHRNRGIGARALELIRDEVFSTTLAVAASMLVPVANERAVRACEKAGFRWRGVERDPALGALWVMAAERPRR